MTLIELLPYIIPPIAGILAGWFLKGWKRQASDNTKADFTNRSDIAEEWLVKLEKLSDVAGKNLMDKEKARAEILKILRLTEEHFEKCEAPKDDFRDFIDFLKQKYHVRQ